MRSQIPDNLLTRVDKDHVIRWEGEDEFWYGDQMFDVIKRVSQNGKEYILCIADADEAAVLKKMANTAYSGVTSGTNGNDGGKIKISLPDIIFFNQFSETNQNLAAFTSNSYSNYYSSKLRDLYRQIPVPPPKAKPVVLLAPCLS